jgi:hypothetical protein
MCNQMKMFGFGLGHDDFQKRFQIINCQTSTVLIKHLAGWNFSSSQPSAMSLGHRNCRVNHFRTGIRQLFGDLEREQGLILDHKHACVHLGDPAWSGDNKPILSL